MRISTSSKIRWLELLNTADNPAVWILNKSFLLWHRVSLKAPGAIARESQMELRG
ncbi:MAG TPA: hypothetical protein VIM41_02630 [Gammaproteobacteria bacterium]